MPIHISSLVDMPDLVREFGVRDLASVIDPDALADAILGLDGELIDARDAMGPADWETDANYIAPRLQSYSASGYQPKRYTTFERVTGL